MTIQIKLRQNACMLIASISLFPMMSFAQVKPMMTTDLLQHLKKGEPWDRSVLAATKMVMFQQSASSGTDATNISKIRLSYFTSANCTGAVAGTGSYTTPNGTSFSISVGTAFGLVAASAWNVGSTQLSIADMSTIQSIAVTFKSTNSNTPQASFSGLSYACIPVSCTSGACTSSSGTQSFTLKTTAAVGDPADGGVIGCQNTGTSFNLFDLVVVTSDDPSNHAWGGSGTTTGATSATNGASNTATIVTTLGAGTYAAITCSQLSVAGGFTSGWFLPSGSVTNSQLNCLYNNRAAIATGSVAAGGSGFGTGGYWSSTEATSTTAWRLNFNNANQTSVNKTNALSVRCARAF